MKKIMTDIRVQSFAAVLVFSMISLFLLYVPKSSSWLHQEDIFKGSYKIGRIDFWLNNQSDDSIPVSFNAIAPTRFFSLAGDRDDHFDEAAYLYEINGTNHGDIDVKVDLSVDDSNTSDTSVFYIFVPAGTTDPNFLDGHYRSYLDTLFAGYTPTTPAECKAAMKAINQNTLNYMKGQLVSAGEDVPTPLGYLIVWTEYDNIAGVNSAPFVGFNYSVNLKAYAYQNFMS